MTYEMIAGYLRGFGISMVPAVLTMLGVCGVRIVWVYTAFAANRTFDTLLLAYPLSLAVTAALLLGALLFYRPAAELAKAMAYLLPTENYGIFHGTCEGDTNWADFTDEIFRLAGKSTKVDHITTEEYVKDNPASANRPAYSILDNFMFRLTGDFRFADWHDAIEEYIRGL